MLKSILLWAFVAVVVIVAAAYTAFQVSPWPSAFLIRRSMDQGGIETARALEKHVPAGVAARLNERYDAGSSDAVLDVFYPSKLANTGQTLPTIVWVHGGAFLSGSKDQIANYLKIVAAKGFTVVGVNYSLAPGQQYPTPIRQVNMALSHLKANATRLHVDPGKLFLAGDSAGAQLAAQLANIISVPSYARDVGVVASIERAQLRGIILHCGLYDPEKLDVEGPLGDFRKTVSWSYFGTKDFFNHPGFAQFSVVRHITAQFPPMFISVGNADRLAPHSRQLAEIAAKLGVPVDGLFFPDDYKPPLPHEYQFNLDTEAGQIALDRMVKFVTDRAQ